MEPTLKYGQIVWVNHWYFIINKIRVGDIVVFEKNGKELIKRISEISNKLVTVIGDNKADSLDSRSFGKVEINKILGKIITS